MQNELAPVPVMNKKVGRNQPCPCGSGNKYKRCCLRKDEIQNRPSPAIGAHAAPPGFHFALEPIDILSNSVPDLINDKRYDDADQACDQLRREYPDVVDGWFRQAMVHEARGNRRLAADYYREAAKMAQQQDGFGSETVQEWLDLADQFAPDQSA